MYVAIDNVVRPFFMALTTNADISINKRCDEKYVFSS